MSGDARSFTAAGGVSLPRRCGNDEQAYGVREMPDAVAGTTAPLLPFVLTASARAPPVHATD